MDVVVPRPYGSKGPVLNDKVHVRVLAINQASGAVVGVMIQPEKRE